MRSRWRAVALTASVGAVGGAARAEGTTPRSESLGRVEATATRPDGTTARAPLGTTVTFPYRQQQLVAQQANGGLAYVSVGAITAGPVPVVVFLHGMNAFGQMHMGFGPPFTDLRAVVDGLVEAGLLPPIVLAAPTHSRGSHAARRMWPEFDLAEFLESVSTALSSFRPESAKRGESVRLDRERVVVVGHSGAACNPGSGLLSPHVRSFRPLAVVAVDTCLYDDVVPELATVGHDVPLFFYWQRAWSRPVGALAEACPSCSVEEIVDLPPKPSTHVTILPVALERALPAIFAAP